ncbi:MAG: B12-binding domain-containing radical SAM protein [Candidatus Omnitrophica bacterium]|nr:B12-binding domain-containing radical SAM protein [Candidatus Omnitrophota bacterium]
MIKRLLKLTSIILIQSFLLMNIAWAGENKGTDCFENNYLSPSVRIDNNQFQQFYSVFCANSKPEALLFDDSVNSPLHISRDEDIQQIRQGGSSGLQERKYPKVILINANHRSSVRSIKPLGIARISAYLKQNKVDTEFVDANRDSLTAQEVAGQVISIRKNYKGKLVLGVSLFPVDTEFLSAFLRALPADIKQDKNLSICAGGYLPTMSRLDFLDKFPEIDFIVVGEGEVPLFKAVQAIADEKPLRGINNIIYRESGGSIITNPQRLLTTEELDSLPAPDYEAILQGKRDFFSKKALLDTAHGCPGRCTFCGIHEFFNEVKSGNFAVAGAALKNLFWRPRSAKRVVDEIEYLYNSYGIRGFDFVDDDFVGTDPKRAKAIAEEIIRRGLKISFWILTRSDSVSGNEEVFVELKKAGLKQVFIGVESNDAKQLKYYGKAITPEINQHAIEILQRLGIGMRIGFINFYKRSTLEQIRNNTAFIEKYNLQPSIPTPANKLMIYKGSALYKRYKREGVKLIPAGETENDYEFDDGNVALLYDITKKFADQTYPLMVYFRELQEMHYYSPSKLNETADMYFKSLKMIEFNFFKEVLALVEEKDGLSAEAKKKLLNIEINYNKQIYALVKEFQDNLHDGYKNEIPFSEKALLATPLDKLKKILVEEGDCWVLHGDLKGLFERNFYYGREAMDVLINKIEESLGGACMRLVSDEFIALIPKKHSKDEVQKMTVRLVAEALEYFKGRYGFAALEINQETGNWKDVLKNTPGVREVVNLPLTEAGNSLRRDFLVFEKEEGMTLEGTLENIVTQVNNSYGKEVITAKMDLPMLAPLLPFGGVRAANVSSPREDLDEWIEDILRVASYLQNIAKQNFPFVKIEEDAVIPMPEIEKEVPADERDSLVKEAQVISKDLKIRPYKLEEIYPAYKRSSLYAIIRDLLLYTNRNVGLYKINVGYTASDLALSKKMYEAKGKRQLRWSDYGKYIFGLKSIWGIFGHKAVNTLILYLNIALNKIFTDLSLNYSVTIVRQPPEVFYLVVDTEKGEPLPFASDILAKLDELTRGTADFLKRNFMLEPVFEASLAEGIRVGNDAANLIEAVDFTSQIRESVQGISSLFNLNRVDTYEEVMANYAQASREYLEGQVKIRERAKSEIEELIGSEEALLAEYRKYLAVNAPALQTEDILSMIFEKEDALLFEELELIGQAI